MNTLFCLCSGLVLGICFFTPPAIAQHTHSNSPYADLTGRTIKTLSQNDIEQLAQGKGWGFALAAELNQYPGPRHVLDLSEELGLSGKQEAEITAIFDKMQSMAIEVGTLFIEAERTLNMAFNKESLSEEEVVRLVQESEKKRAELRSIHLLAHLQTKAVMTMDQVERYDQLRGYSDSKDPCASVPEGHNPELWKKHNNCEGR
ncbi:MAG: hypothetical protein AAFW89_06200 [Bacteroidota bacterium]